MADDAFAIDADYKAFWFENSQPFFAYLKSASRSLFSILVGRRGTGNALSGITLNNGMEYGLVYYPTTVIMCLGMFGTKA